MTTSPKDSRRKDCKNHKCVGPDCEACSDFTKIEPKDCQGNCLPENATPEMRMYDYLGRFTILLNGTKAEKELVWPEELNTQHKMEIVAQMQFILARQRQSILDEVERDMESKRIGPLLGHQHYSRGVNDCIEGLKAILAKHRSVK